MPGSSNPNRATSKGSAFNKSPSHGDRVTLFLPPPGNNQSQHVPAEADFCPWMPRTETYLRLTPMSDISFHTFRPHCGWHELRADLEGASLLGVRTIKCLICNCPLVEGKLSPWPLLPIGLRWGMASLFPFPHFPWDVGLTENIIQHVTNWIQPLLKSRKRIPLLGQGNLQITNQLTWLPASSSPFLLATSLVTLCSVSHIKHTINE